MVQGIQREKQERRIEDLKILIATGFDDIKSITACGYTAKEIKFLKESEGIEMRNMENRSMELKVGIEGIEGKEKGISPVIKKIIDTRLFNGMFLKTVESGYVEFPIKKTTQVKTDIEGGVFITVNDGVVEGAITKIQPEIICVETSFSQQLLNDMDEETKRVYIDDTFVEIIEEVSIGKVVTELNKITPIEITDYAKVKPLLMEKYNPKYYGDNYIIMNTTFYKELSKQLDTTGKNLVINVERDDTDNKIKAFIGVIFLLLFVMKQLLYIL